MKKPKILISLLLIIVFLFGIRAFADAIHSMQYETFTLIKYADSNPLAESLKSLEGMSLQSGSRGQQVAELQLMLINQGYLPAGENDGIFGPKSANAVKAFQTNAGIEATGIADLTTQFLLVMTNATPNENDAGVYVAQSGNYAVIVWPNHDFYIGLLDGNGDLDYGTYHFYTGEYYVGDLDENLRSGEGTAYHTNGDIYVGNWKNDQMSGHGIYYFGGIESGEYYDGNWSLNMMNGDGTYVTATGSKITGTWLNNKHKGW